MPSEADTEAATTAPADEARQVLLEAITADLGDAVVGSHLIAGKDLWIRVTADAWSETASYLHGRQKFRFFNFLSGIDWMPSPFGRSLDATVDTLLEATAGTDAAPAEAAAGRVTGYAGGETRFQVLARVHSLTTNLGLTVKADVPEPALEVGTWTHEYPGAEWHEREAWEMFGISFAGHPGLRHLYLPGDFEGHPLRKDFPLLARLIKPWPGIVDVEPMPGRDDEAGSASTGSASTENPESE
ncbi:MAG: NADH-quinone oxidoreductase subunit C [Actinomycetota bacterium]|nr:NADH-quinone oxidoreductase subunit C [Actinomycetota bacterium]